MTAFTRGQVFVSIDNSNLYVLVRESRPDGFGNYYYNLLNLESGKMRVTEAPRAWPANEPVSLTALNDRFGLDLYPIAQLSEFIPVLRETAEELLDQPSKKDQALSALASV